MVRDWRIVVGVGILLSVASPAAAQTGEQVVPLPTRSVPPSVYTTVLPEFPSDAEEAERRAEVRRWVDEFAAWQEWSTKWRGRRQPGWFTGFRERPEKPAPPQWLATRCPSVFEEDDLFGPACAFLAAWREDGTPTQQVRQVRAATVTEQEAPPNTTWWEHVHMDLMWPALQWQSSVYGVVGMHTATQVGSRLQVFTAPGAMLLNIPARNGTRVWKVAVNYGIGYRLMNFTFPGNRPAELHLNLAKMWLLSDATEVMTGKTTDVIGFSVTFKKR